MTLENKIALLLPEKWEPIKSLKNGDPRREGVNYAIDQCATNLKQAFEEGKICFVPNEEDIFWNLLFVIGPQYPEGPTQEEIDLSNKITKELLSLLTKGKDNATN